jgi:hypothetical protein
MTGRSVPSADTWLATTTERADRTIGACLHVDASIEGTAIWWELSTPAAGATKYGLRLGRRLVYPPPMTEHHAENSTASHRSSLFLQPVDAPELFGHQLELRRAVTSASMRC